MSTDKSTIMGKETSARIQTSILGKAEKKALAWLARRQPRWMTSDTLTYVGVFGTVVYAIGGWLSNANIMYLWLSSFGLVLHWYGDSLDGTLARFRDTQRPVYGFFIDHTLDAVTTCLIFLGTGLSPLLRMDVALACLAGYLSLSVYTYVCTIVKEEFRLTYGKLGPTESRLLLILLNILYMYTPWGEWHVSRNGTRWGAFDILGIIVAIAFFCIYIAQFLKDRTELSRRDPFKPYGRQP